MRIWHEQLIPKLCQKHLCAMWREGLGAYKIITEDKAGYRNHPAVKEYLLASLELWRILELVRNEMLSRNYNPKPMPKEKQMCEPECIIEWQTLEQQIEVLKTKGCKCQV